MTDQEWEERQKTRQLEMQAVSKALAILSSDDAHDLFTKTFNPSLLETSIAVSSGRRSQASQVLKAAAQRLQSPRLAQIAMRVRLDAFEREKKEREKTDLEAKIEDLTLTIKTLTEEIEALKAEIAEMQVQLKRAGEDREAENKDFQMTVADQRATQ